MLRKNPRNHRGAFRINTAQAVIFLIAIGCVGVVLNTYQKSKNDDTAIAPPAVPPSRDPKYLRYAGEVSKWQSRLASQQMTVTWPYNNWDYAARLDLPNKVPITLADWDARSEQAAAKQAYGEFVKVRVKARVDDPTSCVVHVFVPSSDGGMEEVAQANASGVTLPGG